MYEAFQMGGWGMYPTLIAGLVLVLTSVRYAVDPQARWVPLMLSLGSLTLVAGGLGFVTGVIRTTMALAEVPGSRALIQRPFDGLA